MFTRLIIFALFLLQLSVVHAQKKDTVVISDTLLKLEKEASFAGGQKGWENFLRMNLDPNVPVDNGAPSGRYMVVVEFIVDTLGNASDFKALTNWGYGMEQEVLRILKKSGGWEPAKLRGGTSVKAYRKQPVTFVFYEDGFTVTTQTPNTLYTEIDNPVTITADNIKPENLIVTVSKNATIEAVGNSKYIVKVLDKSERVVFTLTNSKKNKAMGQHSIEARTVPVRK
jgi:hypothetical protein